MSASMEQIPVCDSVTVRILFLLPVTNVSSQLLQGALFSDILDLD